MNTYLIVFAVIFSAFVISGVINIISEKIDKNSFTTEFTHLLANGFGIVSVFMFFGGLLGLC